jgi:chromosome partitioning protein
MSSIISIAQTKGGSGKTTTVLCLAGYWVTQGKRVAVVDADGPQHHAANWLKDLPPGSKLSAVTISTLQDIGASANALAERMVELAGRHDIVLVDMLGADSNLLSLAVANSDLTLVPVPASPLDADGAATTRDRIEDISRQIGRPLRYKAFLTKVKPRTKLYDEVKRQLVDSGIDLCATEWHDRVIYQEGMLTGGTPSIDAPGSTAAKEIASLAAEIEGILNG